MLTPESTALVLVDMQNDFLHGQGAYARGGAAAPEIAALANKLVPIANAMREFGGWIASTHFTLVPSRDGEPFISSHLRELRPFLGKGDFAPGSFGQALVDELAPADLSVEKVAFSAFYMSRLEWVLHKAGIETLVFTGIVTNGGVESTVRDAHVRDFHSIVLEDGCAAFSEEIHEASIGSMRSIAEVTTIAEMLERLRK